MVTPTKKKGPVGVKKPPETKEQTLYRLAGKRVEKACKAISLIGNLSAYKPTNEDVDRIMEALGGVCSNIEQRLRGGTKQKTSFTLRQIPPSGPTTPATN